VRPGPRPGGDDYDACPAVCGSRRLGAARRGLQRRGEPSLSATRSFTAGYSQLSGRQKIEHLEGEPNDVLEASFLGGAFEQAALTLTTSQTNGEPMETNSSA
jgi:hypothetical protein